MRKKRKPSLALIVIAVVILGIIAWFRLSHTEPQVGYLTEPARMGDIRRVVNATGQIDPVQLVDVGAQVSGQIERLYVVLGQEVSKGDLIAEIDSTTQVNDLETTKARLASYEAQMTSQEVSVRVAKTNYDREVQLSRTDSTSRLNLDNAESTYASAVASLRELESQILQTRISLDTAQTNLGYTRITAPLDGTVVSVPVEEGQTVNANQTTPTIVQIADLTQMEIKIEIAEGDITKVHPGQTVEYSILSEPGLTFRTTLHSIDPGLTSLSDGTYSKGSSSNEAIYYYAKALVDNSEGRLRIGMTTQNVIVVDEARQTLMVPSLGINRGPNGSMVRVLMNGNRVEMRDVEVGISDNMNTQILAGVNEGEEVIITELGSNETVSSANMRGPGMRR